MNPTIPVGLFSAPLQPTHQLAMAHQHSSCPASSIQLRSSSVIVQAGNGTMDMDGSCRQQQHMIGTSRPQQQQEGKRPSREDVQGGGQAKVQKLLAANVAVVVKRAVTPASEVLGVSRFISPFSPEAKIPLPHELNELSAHGTTVWKRNERERQRVRCVNEGYSHLRGQLPLTEQDRRLSKVDTLRLAIAYIRHLELLLDKGRAHQPECQCFIGLAQGEGSSAENTPSP